MKIIIPITRQIIENQFRNSVALFQELLFPSFFLISESMEYKLVLCDIKIAIKERTKSPQEKYKKIDFLF